MKEAALKKKRNTNTSIDQLIPIKPYQIGVQKIQGVNARNVYEFLGVKTVFADWIKRNIKKYNFAEGIDYLCFSDLRSKEGKGGHNIKEYYITLDMAKELCMVQNNPKSKQIRQYFIRCEKELIKLHNRQNRHIQKKGEMAYQKARQEGKIIRHEETNMIKDFVEYATAQGSIHAKRYYENITKMVNKHLFYLKLAIKPDNLREWLDTMQLIQLTVADDLVAKALKEGMKEGMLYGNIYKMAKERIIAYSMVIGQTPVLPEESTPPNPPISW